MVIVSSGAIGVGLQRMDKGKRPKHLAQLQALAAIGQCRLMGIWDGLFSHFKQPVAQILLTRNDIADVSEIHLLEIPSGRPVPMKPQPAIKVVLWGYFLWQVLAVSTSLVDWRSPPLEFDFILQRPA